MARAPRRARAAGPPRAELGGLGQLSELPPFELGYPRTELRRKLVDAVLRGDKTTTTGLLEGREAPDLQAGVRLALLGFDDEPVGVVEVTDVRVVAACEIDLQFARDEGEGFESVEEWRVAHERFFQQPIDDDTEMVAVWFRLVERT